MGMKLDATPPEPERRRAPELTVIMPCLNEVETIVRCITKAHESFRLLGISGEVLIADNGSTDGSQKASLSVGARVVSISEKGYGNALRGGIAEARGKYIIMGDSDDSYDFSALGPFVERLRLGDDLVMGNRFKGGIMPGAMPWKHRWIGNPVLTAIGRLFFGSRVGDFHCGLRGFTAAAFRVMDLRTSGMEFASEMVIKSTLLGLTISEVPTVLHKDGRSRAPHLRSWRDGWRHLRFMLLFCPTWLFLIPGLTLFLGGLASDLWLLGGPRRLGTLELDIHTMLVSAFATSIGYQVLAFGFFTRTYAAVEGFYPPHPWISILTRPSNLERWLVAGILLVLLGLVFLVLAVSGWKHHSFGQLNPRITMRHLIPSTLLITLGVQSIFSSFFLGVLTPELRRQRNSQSSQCPASEHSSEGHGPLDKTRELNANGTDSLSAETTD